MSPTTIYKMNSPDDVSVELLARLQQGGGELVLAAGVFDLLHSEHTLFLEKARAAGAKLVVGVESDVRVKELKGQGRPIETETIRAQKVAELGLAEVVLILPEVFNKPADYRALVATLQPAILAVSSHSDHQQEKQQLMQSFGGRLEVVHQHNPAVSTTQLLQQRAL